MGQYWLQSLAMYGLAIIISLAVALLIKGIVAAVASSGTRKTTVPTSPATPTTGDIVPHHIPVIAAAVSAMLGAHRIVRIESRQRSQVWTAEGRVSHHISHAPHRPSRR